MNLAVIGVGLAVEENPHACLRRNDPKQWTPSHGHQTPLRHVKELKVPARRRWEPVPDLAVRS
jgi:hypothetical protein